MDIGIISVICFGIGLFAWTPIYLLQQSIHKERMKDLQSEGSEKAAGAIRMIEYNRSIRNLPAHLRPGGYTTCEERNCDGNGM